MNGKRTLLLAGLAVGLTVIWSTGVPAQMVADQAALVGGQVMIGCCLEQATVECNEVYAECCGNPLTVCVNVGIGPKRCYRYDYGPCGFTQLCYSIRTEQCLSSPPSP